MDPWTMMAIMAAASVVKNKLFDEPRAEKQKAQVAATQKYSPWTGRWADQSQIQDPNYFGDALSWGTTGAMLGQNAQTQAGQQKLMDAQTNYMNAQTYGQPQGTMGYDYYNANQPQKFSWLS